MKAIQKIFDGIWAVVETLSAVVLAVVTVVCFYQIISRYIFQSSNAGIDELTRLAFVWCASLGSALAFRKGSHLGVTAIVSKLKGNAAKIAQLIIQLAVLALMVIVTIAGFTLVEKGMKQFSEYLRLNMAIFYGCIPCGAIFSIVACVENIFHIFVKKEEEVKA